ncbi:hypothetical protein HQ531_02875 [bacterium]|nr:hypothetical protein [bacterium]
MNTLIKVIVMSLIAGSLFALPRFAMMEEVNCVTCHSYGGGGAGRNSYGKEYIRESLVYKDLSYPWINEESESSFGFGLDTRYQMISKADTDIRHFPMQLALYANAELDNLVIHGEVNRINDEFRISGGIRYEGLPLESYVTLAKALPIMGWKIDDHTVFTRGGNLSVLGLPREGMPYTPYIKAPLMAEFGSVPLMGFEISLMAGTPIINSADSVDVPYFTALRANYSYSGDFYGARVGIAFLDDAQQSNAQVVTWGLSIMGFVWLGEISELDGWPETDLTNFASFQQLSYRIVQGLDLIGRYEFFDPDEDLSNGAIERMTLGIEMFPIPGMEIKLSYRSSQLELPENAPEAQGQYLTQFHFYL